MMVSYIMISMLELWLKHFNNNNTLKTIQNALFGKAAKSNFYVTKKGGGG